MNSKICAQIQTIPGQDICVVPTIQQGKRCNNIMGVRDNIWRGTKGIAFVPRLYATLPLAEIVNASLDDHRALRFDYGIVQKNGRTY